MSVMTSVTSQAGDRRYFKFGMQINRNRFQPTDNKLSLKGVRSRYVIHFKFQGLKHNLVMTEARIVKFLTQVGYI